MFYYLGTDKRFAEALAASDKRSAEALAASDKRSADFEKRFTDSIAASDKRFSDLLASLKEVKVAESLLLDNKLNTIRTESQQSKPHQKNR